MGVAGLLSVVLPLCVVFLAVYLTRPTIPVSPKLITWRNDGKYFNFNGSPIFYKDSRKGNAQQLKGSVLVCLHGFPTSSFDWSKVWSDLEGRFDRVIAADFLGFGFSDKPKNHNYTIGEQADVIEALLQELGISRYHILAHDYGDTVALELLHRNHERTSDIGSHPVILSTCLSNGGVFPETNHPRPLQKLLLVPYIGAVLGRLTFYELFKKGLGDVFGPETQPTEEEFSAFYSAVLHNDGYAINHKLLQYIPQRQVNKERWVGVLKKSNVPVCMIYGPADPVNPPAFIEHYKATVRKPACITVLRDNVGHYPQVEAPREFIAAYFSFLDKVKSK